MNSIVLWALIASIVTCIMTYFFLEKKFRHQKEQALFEQSNLYNSEKQRLDDNCIYLQERLGEFQVSLQNSTLENQHIKSELDDAKPKLIIFVKQETEINNLKYLNGTLEQKNADLIHEKQDLSNQITHWKTKFEVQEKQTLEKLNLLHNAKENLSSAFKVLANEILEEKSKRFTDQNQQNLHHLLDPLRLQIKDFKDKVELVHQEDIKDRISLNEQVKSMMVLNQQLSLDANNLAKALKGDNKLQGNFGEMILEKILTSAGLIKDINYYTQQSHINEEGLRIQPDIIINLPNERHIILDAKTSINAYNEYDSALDDETKKTSLKKHLQSINSHIDILYGKKYQQVYQDKSPDFVLMFIPLEPAFNLAISNDNNLWHKAWEKNILLVSPSNLILIIRIISNIWKQDNKNKNAQEISKRGGELYDKLCGFLKDFQSIGTSLENAKKNYDEALNKFSQGKGNAVRQAEMLKNLGIENHKKLPQNLLDLNLDIHD